MSKRDIFRENNPFWGKKHSEETKARMKAIWEKRKKDPSWKPRKLTEEDKLKLSLAKSGIPNPNCSRPMEKNAMWKGGRRINQRGHVAIRNHDHPNSNGGYVLEHRLIASRVLGRPLVDGEIIHHLNRNPADNTNENLIICDQSYHDFLHHKMRRLGLAPKMKKRHRSPTSKATKTKISIGLKNYYRRQYDNKNLVENPHLCLTKARF